MNPSPPAPDPGGTDGRSLAPDLARGVMLLVIALAHAPAFVGDWTRGPAPLNATAEFIKYLVTDNQARAMFVFLFGYGLGQLARRQLDRGGDWTSLRALLRRRGFWLLAIGFAHAALLVPLDIIAVYGLTLLMLAPLVRSRDSALLWTAALVSVPATLLIAWQGVTAWTTTGGGAATLVPYMTESPVHHVLFNLRGWPVETLVSVLVVVPGLLWGVWAARRRILDEPERHTVLLRRSCVLLLGAALMGRLPLALLLTGVWESDSAALVWVFTTAHTLAGYAGGIGMAACVGLVAIRIGRDRGRVTTGLAALGQRSMTFYLFQSVVFVALFYPFTLDLSGELGIAGSYGVATAVWAASVLLAAWMHVRGVRGPAETLLRRLSDRPADRAPSPR
ncbi:DUF418 domain-containing protein [Nocardiopsis sp. NPDC058631]|uniref:DUF418 domain-containing protein n=1 Tax=Nocardiopsis sp. NPDC058631 TaxID=3346566 RepID=UPI0036617C7D